MDNQNQTQPQSSEPTSTPGPTPPPQMPTGVTGQPAQPYPLDNPAPSPAASAPTPSTNPLSSNIDPPPSHRPAGPAPTSTLATIASGFSSVLGAIFSWVIFPVAVVLILHNFVFQAYHVLGTSMVPTLHETDYLIVSKLGYTGALVKRAIGQNQVYIPARNQIVVFRYPKDPSKVFVKRVIGLPGDRIVIKNGTVTVFNKDNPNGFNPDVTFENKDTTTLIDTDEVVQDGNIFVMGDNRTPGGSYDSREWGELPSSYIIGNAVLRLLPLDQIRIL